MVESCRVGAWAKTEGGGGGFPIDKVAFAGADKKFVGDDLVLTFTAEKIAAQGLENGSLQVIDGDCDARILLVGGGGGGGFVNTIGVSRGGAGGGGAGGMVERSGVSISGESTYTIKVGLGGEGSKVHLASGENGSPSSILVDGVELEKALGGGGGGSQSQGKATEEGVVGSGGGSSQVSSSVKPVGGRGTEGQGNDGGSGGVIEPVSKAGTYRGGGGGGAGGIGQNGSVEFYHGGFGGLAKVSDITGEDVYYAGGGGGAYTNVNNTTGSKYFGGFGGGVVDDESKRGGGGNGGGVDGGDGFIEGQSSGKAMNVIPAQNGTNGLGGGGGGGGSFTTDKVNFGGNGGSGVVIVRLSNYRAKSPYDYEVDYIKSDGVAYVDTGFYFDNTTKGLHVDFKFGSNSKSNECVLGYTDVDYTTVLEVYLASKNTFSIAVDDGNTYLTSKTTSFVHTSCEYNYMNNGVMYASTPPTSNTKSLGKHALDTTRSVYVFSFNTDGHPEFTAKDLEISSLKFSDGAEITVDLIPVVKDGVAFFYDKISKRLFGNANPAGGELIAGPRKA